MLFLTNNDFNKVLSIFNIKNSQKTRNSNFEILFIHYNKTYNEKRLS